MNVLSPRSRREWGVICCDPRREPKYTGEGFALDSILKFSTAGFRFLCEAVSTILISSYLRKHPASEVRIFHLSCREIQRGEGPVRFGSQPHRNLRSSFVCIAHSIFRRSFLIELNFRTELNTSFDHVLILLTEVFGFPQGRRHTGAQRLTACDQREASRKVGPLLFQFSPRW